MRDGSRTYSEIFATVSKHIQNNGDECVIFAVSVFPCGLPTMESQGSSLVASLPQWDSCVIAGFGPSEVVAVNMMCIGGSRTATGYAV